MTTEGLPTERRGRTQFATPPDADDPRCQIEDVTAAAAAHDVGLGGVLLAGGEKDSQDRGIRRALRLANDLQEESL